MSTSPKISIVIPMYNVELYIGDCLDSILHQSFTDYEIIVVDDGSTDKSIDLAVMRLGNQAKCQIVRQPNAGLSAARNAGLKAANGEYVLFLDSDDWLEEEALGRIVEHSHGEDLICFSGRKWYQDTQLYETADELLPATYATGWEYYNENALQSRKFPFVCAVLRLYRRKFLLENKLYFTAGIYHEDNMFTPYVCLYAKATKVINESIYIYRIRKGSITTQPKLKNIQDKLWIANEQATFFARQANISKTVVYKSITHLYHNVFDYLRYVKYQDRVMLLNEINWKLYYEVTRTKFRHKLYYIAMRMSPKVYYLIRKFV